MILKIYANSDSEGGAGDDSGDANSDSGGGSSEVEGENDVSLKSADNVIIYVDDSSNDVAPQTDPSELGSSCKFDPVVQKLDKVLEAVELISSEMRVAFSDIYDIKQRCKVMENQLILMVC